MADGACRHCLASCWVDSLLDMAGCWNTLPASLPSYSYGAFANLCQHHVFLPDRRRSHMVDRLDAFEQEGPAHTGRVFYCSGSRDLAGPTVPRSAVREWADELL